MSQKNIAVFHKTLLAFAVTSVLAGWAYGEDDPKPVSSLFSNSCDDSKSKTEVVWPPEKRVIVEDGKQCTNPDGDTVITERNIKNILIEKNGKFINEGQVDGDTATLSFSNYVIQATEAGAEVINKGEMNSQGTSGTYAANSLILIGGDGSVAINEGVMTVEGQGSSWDYLPRAFQVVMSRAAEGAIFAKGINKETGRIFVVGDSNQGMLVNEGEVINEGLIDVTGSASYGMQAGVRNTAYSPKSFSLRSAIATNKGKIIVSGQKSYGMKAHRDGAPQDRVVATIPNTGSIQVESEAEAAGMVSDTTGTVVRHDGVIIAAHPDAVGIKMTREGQLRNIGKIVTKGTAISLEGDFSDTEPKPDIAFYNIVFQPGSYIESTATDVDKKIAFKGEGTGVYPVHIMGGTFKGDIVVEKGANGHLFIESPDVVPVIKNGPIDIQGEITGFQNFDVSGTGWKTSGWVKGTKVLKTSSVIDHVYVSDKKEDVEASAAASTLRFVTVDEPGLTVLLNKAHPGKIRHIHLHGKAHLHEVNGVERITVASTDKWVLAGPLSGVETVYAEGSEQAPDQSVIDTIILVGEGAGKSNYRVLSINAPVPTETTKPVEITSNGSGLIHDLSIGDSAHIGGISGVRNLLVEGGGETENKWQVHGVIKDPKTVTVGKKGYATKIAAKSKASKTAQTLAVNFLTYTDEDYLEIINRHFIGAVDFSNPNRPNLHYVQEAGGNNNVQLIGNETKADALILKGGDPIDCPPTFSRVAYEGAKLPSVLATDTKRFEMRGEYSLDLIQVSDTPTPLPVSNRLLVPFSKTPPDKFYLKSASDIQHIDFSNDQRPMSFIYELAGGVTGQLTGNREKHDTLIFSGDGTLSQLHTDTLKALQVTGVDWTANGVFSGLENIVVKDKGHVTSLSVAGKNPEITKDVVAETLSVVTHQSSPPMNISMSGKGVRFHKVIIREGAKLGDITFDGSGSNKVKLAYNVANWQAGTITNAGQFTAKSDISQLYIDGAPGHPGTAANCLYFKTMNDPGLSLFVKKTATINTLTLDDGGYVSSMKNNGTIDHMVVTGKDWSVNNWIKGVNTLTTASVIEHLYVDSEPSMQPETKDKASRLRFATGTPEDKQPLTIKTSGEGKVGELNLHSKANLGNVSGVDNINIKSSESWQIGGVITNPKSMMVTGIVDEIIAGNIVPKGIKDQQAVLDFTGSYTSEDFFELSNMDGGQINRVDFSADSNRPALKFIQDGGTSETVLGNVTKGDTLVLMKGHVTKLSGFQNYEIKGSDWVSLNLVDPVMISVSEGGLVNIIDDLPEPEPKPTQPIDRIDVSFTQKIPDPQVSTSAVGQSGKALPMFVIANTGGIIDNIDFSNSVRPELVFYSGDGKTGYIKGSPGLGDKLILEAGDVKGVDGFEDIEITGKKWIVGTVTNPATVTVTNAGAVSELTTVPVTTSDPTVKNERLALSYTEELVPKKCTTNGVGEVVVTSSGEVHEMNFMDDALRPKMKVLQEGGTIGSIKGRAGYGDSIDVTGSTISGNVAGLDSLTFSGANTVFGGTEIQTMGVVNVTGRLNLTSGSKVIVKPVDGFKLDAGQKTGTLVQVAKGATLKVANERQPAGSVDTFLEVTGDYKQDGILEVPLNTITDFNMPFVKATTIELGEHALLKLNNEHVDVGTSKDYILMESDQAISRTIPVETLNQNRYTSYVTKLDTKKQLLLSTMPMSTRVGNLAKAGGASGSAQRAIKIAVDMKITQSPKSATSVIDPLNDWIIAQVRAVYYDPAKVADIAKRMTPDNTGANVTLAKEGLRQAGSAIGSRQSGLRTGISAGDMFTSGGAWLQYAYSDATQKKKGGVYGYEAKTNGFSIGGETDFNVGMGTREYEESKIGLAYTYSDGDAKAKGGSGSKVDTEAHVFSLYTSTTNDAAFFDVRLSYSMGKNKGKRYVQNNGLKTKYDTSSWDIGLMAGYDMPLGESADWKWQPLLAFNYAISTLMTTRKRLILANMRIPSGLIK